MIYPGNAEIIDGFSFIQNYIKENHKKKMPNNFNCVGLTFNYLTVLEDTGKTKGIHKLVKVRCKCGKEKTMQLCKLTNNSTKSCGCYKDSKKTNEHKIAYEYIKNNRRLYGIYSDMKSRCLNQKSKAYNYYGGRGIKVCSEWLGEEGFTTFFEWSMANGYADNLEIDRIDVNGNYEPNNCRWATKKEQSRNKRNTIYLEYFGEKKTLFDWADMFNIKYPTISSRYHKGIRNERELFVRRRTNMITPANYEDLIAEHKDEMQKNPESAKRKMIADTVTVMKQFGYDCGVEELLIAFNLENELLKRNEGETK